MTGLSRYMDTPEKKQTGSVCSTSGVVQVGPMTVYYHFLTTKTVHNLCKKLLIVVCPPALGLISVCGATISPKFCWL